MIQERCINTVIQGVSVVVRTSHPSLSPRVIKNITKTINQLQKGGKLLETENNT